PLSQGGPPVETMVLPTTAELTAPSAGGRDRLSSPCSARNIRPDEAPQGRRIPVLDSPPARPYPACTTRRPAPRPAVRGTGRPYAIVCQSERARNPGAGHLAGGGGRPHLRRL